MNILAIETSSTWGSVAVSRDSQIVYNSYLDIKITHSERLLPQIDEAFKQTGMLLKNLDLITISNGPGSFTGIRIGLAVAKGLCLGAEKPLYPVNTLRLLAYNLYGSRLPVVPFMDARMGEIYAAMYSGEIAELIAPCNARPAEFLEQIDREVILTGSGVNRFAAEIKASGIKFSSALLHQQIPQAQTLLALVLHENPSLIYDLEKISTLEPWYLRKSQAELLKEDKS
ncbi:MAG: tRNA (adenosine(37)-N6)-threonylcarbamoyltransferase complex dimerization subunit type 1 TsaB [Candidatus Cloacimonetes bacterium]|nr:tRNA (adenosine(37)-N6)-threonylcarbamoyltransferase complex dimerization subunit type 1 TsaB [Candidatus Cloacimonadota bacterium]